MKIVSKVGKLVRLTLRERVAAAFARIAGAVDARTAQRRTKDFYRSSGAAWTRSRIDYRGTRARAGAADGKLPSSFSAAERCSWPCPSC